VGSEMTGARRGLTRQAEFGTAVYSVWSRRWRRRSSGRLEVEGEAAPGAGGFSGRLATGTASRWRKAAQTQMDRAGVVADVGMRRSEDWPGEAAAQARW
jgi:hypothetical protein